MTREIRARFTVAEAGWKSGGVRRRKVVSFPFFAKREGVDNNAILLYYYKMRNEIYVTGDTHGSEDFLKLRLFADAKPHLSKSDYVIVAGDFGGVWSEKTLDRDLKIFEDLPFTVLFVDGNHENFDLLNSFPVTEWNGGKVHMIRPDVIHLMRGQVFEIERNTIFTFGGATSIDKAFRREGISWWAEEVPSYEELDEGMANLKRYGNKVDYVVTHSCGERALMYPPLRTRDVQMRIYPENRLLSCFEDTVEYGKWYFGHYHTDGRLNDKMTVLYRKIVPLGE